MNTIWERALLEPVELLGRQVLAILPNLLHEHSVAGRAGDGMGMQPLF